MAALEAAAEMALKRRLAWAGRPMFVVHGARSAFGSARDRPSAADTPAPRRHLEWEVAAGACKSTLQHGGAKGKGGRDRSHVNGRFSAGVVGGESVAPTGASFYYLTVWLHALVDSGLRLRWRSP